MNNQIISDKRYKDKLTDRIPNNRQQKIILILFGILTLPSFIIGFSSIIGVDNLISLAPGLLSPTLTGFIITYFVIGLFFGFGLLIVFLNIFFTIPIIYLVLRKDNLRGLLWLRNLSIINVLNPIHGTFVSILLLIFLRKYFYLAPKIFSSDFSYNRD